MLIQETLVNRIRLGAAVRLKGLWKQKNPPQATHDESVSSPPSQSAPSSAGDSKSPKPSNPGYELQVSEVQLIGESDPDVSYRSPKT